MSSFFLSLQLVLLFLFLLTQARILFFYAVQLLYAQALCNIFTYILLYLLEKNLLYMALAHQLIELFQSSSLSVSAL